MKNSKSVLLAIATASIFATAVAIAQDASQSQTAASQAATPADPTQAVKCYGLNSCKGKSQCQTANNSCSGKNSCKGNGFMMVPTQQECLTKGGSLTGPTRPPTTQSATTPYGQ